MKGPPKTATAKETSYHKSSNTECILFGMEEVDMMVKRGTDFLCLQETLWTGKAVKELGLDC